MKTACASAATPRPHLQEQGVCREDPHDLGSPQEGPSSRRSPDAGVVGEALGQEALALSLEAERSLPRLS